MLRLVFAALLGLGSSASLDLDSEHYQYWCTGNCNSSVSTKTEPGTILMGGGTDVDAAFKQHIKWSGGGDFLVIRATGTDAYNPYIKGLGKVNSVATLLTKDKEAAEEAFVLGLIKNAEAIFFAGGDQWTYLQEWQGTSMQKALQAAIARGVPVGGTSAGCDIQGNYIYTAEHDTVVSSEALEDPFNKCITLQEKPFIGHPSHLLNKIIIDTHFITRDRMGRLVAFLARLWKDGREAYAIGIDEQTALAIDASGKATMFMQGSEGGRAFVLTPAGSADTCEKGHNLEYERIPVQKLDAKYGDTYNFATMTGGVSSQRYTISARDGELSPYDPYSPSGGERRSHNVIV